jgi:hypothetical protein
MTVGQSISKVLPREPICPENIVRLFLCSSSVHLIFVLGISARINRSRHTRYDVGVLPAASRYEGNQSSRKRV